MPTYEYRCKDCGQDLEAVQGFHDEPLTECPSCGGTLRKKFGTVGISFKGSGFYKNDSRGSSKSESKPSEPKPSESTSSDSTSSDSKSSASGSSDTSSSSSSSSAGNGSGSSGDSGSKSKTPAAT